ncbi:MAG: SHD1 domain-containing protein [Planctomycetota bacterium]|jgi:hypothetical protein
MPFARSWIRRLWFCLAVFAIAPPAIAQLEKLPYKVGDRIEVNFLDAWREGIVTEIMPGGFALKADFVDESGKKRNFLFASENVRDGREATDPEPATLDMDIEVKASENEPNRTWKSSNGSYSVVAKLLGTQGDSVILLKVDGDRVIVALSKLSEEDLQYVENTRRAMDSSDAANPFEEPGKKKNAQANDPFAEKDTKKTKRPLAPQPKKENPLEKNSWDEVAPTRPKSPASSPAPGLRSANSPAPSPSGVGTRQTQSMPPMNLGLTALRWGPFLVLLASGLALIAIGLTNSKRYF